ncbi:serine/threonine protein kinase [Dietzia sp. 179-F 9C3 NHS]|uniref:serine/threonine protein kinase n=1 Tax=Dietzia sp. 179-F 9C3 NHS TaxID=3374295 RepID=UPI00387A3591
MSDVWQGDWSRGDGGGWNEGGWNEGGWNDGADWAGHPYGGGVDGSGGNGIIWALVGLVVVLVVAMGGVLGYMLTRSDDPGTAVVADTTTEQPAEETVTSQARPTSASPTTETEATSRSTTTSESTEASTSSSTFTPAPNTVPGDLGLSVPMTRPSCDGRGIVVLYSAVTPGQYEQEVSAALARNPGALYLRTDQSCPSLRQRDPSGNVIYAVYRPSGYSKAELCADVRTAGGDAYGRWLDTTSDPNQIVTC